MSGGRPRRLALLAVYGRTPRPGARFAFGPLKAGFASSDRLASPIGGIARPCGRRCRLWARNGALRAHFFAASFGLDTASRGTAARRFALLGPVLDAGNLQPSASCSLRRISGDRAKLCGKLVSTLEFARGLYHILRYASDGSTRFAMPGVRSRVFLRRPLDAYRHLQDGWFGACGPDGWLHESYMSRIGVKPATVANLTAERAGLTPADSTRIAPVSHQPYVKSSVINACGGPPTSLKLLLPTAAASH